MSAYVVDPRTIDYLVAWTRRHNHRHAPLTRTRILWRWMHEVPADYKCAVDGSEDFGYRLVLARLTPDQIGQILMTENVRSVRARYPEDSADDLPGPIDQRRVWRYTYRPIQNDLIPAWVVSSCDCLSYQSCETADWTETIAHAIVQAIREDAIRDMIDDAPWGVTDEDLALPVAV